MSLMYFIVALSSIQTILAFAALNYLILMLSSIQTTLALAALALSTTSNNHRLYIFSALITIFSIPVLYLSLNASQDRRTCNNCDCLAENDELEEKELSDWIALYNAKDITRKDTGTLPFHCYCGRRFSTLDNLREHAQTSHLFQEFLDRSRAATGTKFQRL